MPQLLSLPSRAHQPQLLSTRAATAEAWMPRARARQQEKHRKAMKDPVKSSPCLPQLEKVHAQQQRPSAAKNK